MNHSFIHKGLASKVIIIQLLDAKINYESMDTSKTLLALHDSRDIKKIGNQHYHICFPFPPKTM